VAPSAPFFTTESARVDQHFGEHNSVEMWLVCRRLFQVTTTHARTHTHTLISWRLRTTATTKAISHKMAQLCPVFALSIPQFNSAQIPAPHCPRGPSHGPRDCHRPLHSSSSHSMYLTCICSVYVFLLELPFPPSLSVHQCTDLLLTLSNTSS
jgi:hypothetical protein